MTFDKSGKPIFVDKEDKSNFKKLLSHINNKGVQYFVLRIENYYGNITTDRQIAMWNVICNLIQLESGNDWETINETLNTTGVSVEGMNNQQFTALMEYTFAVCEEFFNVQLTMSTNGNIEILRS